jgi:hypothetical protein
MRRMRRIERAAEQADAHAARMRRQHDAAKIATTSIATALIAATIMTSRTLTRLRVSGAHG